MKITNQNSTLKTKGSAPATNTAEATARNDVPKQTQPVFHAADFTIKPCMGLYAKSRNKRPLEAISLTNLYNMVAHDESVLRHTEEMRKAYIEKGYEAYKNMKVNKTLLVMPAGVFGTDKRKENMKMRSRILALDVDYVHQAPNLDPTPANELKAKILDDKNLPWLLVFKSCNKGLKIFFPYDTDRFDSTEDPYNAYSQYFIDKYGVDPKFIDPVCKNENRGCFVFGDPEAVLREATDELPEFDFDTWVAKAAEAGKTSKKRKAKAAKTDGATETTVTTETEAGTETEAETSTYQDETNLEEARDEALALVECIDHFGIHVCDTYDRYMETGACFAHSFGDDEEMKEACRKVCKASEGYDEADFEKLYESFAHDERSEDLPKLHIGTFNLKAAEAVAEPWKKMPFTKRLKFETLPPVLKRLTEYEKNPVYADHNILAFLTALSGAMRGFQYPKVNGTMGKPTLYTVFTGGPGSNKSRLTPFFNIASAIDSKLEEAWQKEHAEWEAKPEPRGLEPLKRSFSMAADTTAPAFAAIANANKGEGMMSSSEFGQLITSKDKRDTYGNLSSCLCQGYEGEDMRVDRKTERVHIHNPHISLLATGTLADTHAFMTRESFQNGLASRCIIYPMPDRYYTPRLGMHLAKATMAKQKMEKELKFYFTEFHRLLHTTGNRTVTVCPTESQWLKLQRFMFSAAHMYRAVVFPSSSRRGDEFLLPVLKRAEDRTFRLMVLLGVLDLLEKRLKDSKETLFDGEVPDMLEVSDEIVDAAIDMAKTLLDTTLEVLVPIAQKIKRSEATRYGAAFRGRAQAGKIGPQGVFDLLPATFRRTDVESLGGLEKSQASFYIVQWQSQGLIQKGANYTYCKVTTDAADDTSEENTSSAASSTTGTTADSAAASKPVSAPA